MRHPWRWSNWPRSALAALAWSTAVPAPGAAQYFGQNRVLRHASDFAVIETEHFEVFYPRAYRREALEGAQFAERAYNRLARLLNHRYRERQPLILFASEAEFYENNVTPVGEGTAGVTEPYRHRVLLPFATTTSEFEHILVHELVHQFQFDVYAGGRIGAAIPGLMATRPPLWFLEGMAEYLSVGPIDPQTAMWLRDALLRHALPSAQTLMRDGGLAPYRFGHALFAYIGERWGDATIGELLQATAVSGVEAASTRVLGRSLQALVDEWRSAVAAAYTPQLASLEPAQAFATPALVPGQRGTLRIAPALSPDGRYLAYLSEGDSYFVDLYLADPLSGRVLQRLVRSAFRADYESLRFIYSAAAWSPDGQRLAMAVRHENRDDLVIIRVPDGTELTRIAAPVATISTPAWSPDGSEIVFAGQDGGATDLFVATVNGSAIRRLTDDRFADLHPTWSPDGRTIAFVTDRPDTAGGPSSPLAIALLDLASGTITRASGMTGRNTNPQFSPDGRTIAFVSDRTGIPNVFLLDRGRDTVWQLTNVETGVAGLTPYSPAISWAWRADQLAFSYFGAGTFDLYVAVDPRALRDKPFPATAPPLAIGRLLPPTDTATAPPAAVAEPSRDEPPLGYRTVRELMAADDGRLPDTTTFRFRNYRPGLAPEYVGVASIGYVRDNFGSGVYGGTAIELADMLATHRVVAGLEINGRIEEARVLGMYASTGKRIQWAAGLAQYPVFYYTGSDVGQDPQGRPTLETHVERLIYREVFAQAAYPLDRFRRLELRARGVQVRRDVLEFTERFDDALGRYGFDRQTLSLGSGTFTQPAIAFVFDNAQGLAVGPFFGRRSRFQYAPAFGDLRFHEVLLDYRRYDNLTSWLTFASRLFLFGRYGEASNQFPVFLGTTELVRGYTAGSLRAHECREAARQATRTGCAALDRLIGSRVAAVSAEVRAPIVRGERGPLPPAEAAVFVDAGIAWDRGSALAFRPGTDGTALTRWPVASWGMAMRVNMYGLFVLRADLTRPLSRPHDNWYVTLSLGPTF
ncbi:MAG TPA: hypothetical protein VGA22_02700 [Gemmatimonadales bacterium]|jgi:hypothetical protein